MKKLLVLILSIMFALSITGTNAEEAVFAFEEQEYSVLKGKSITLKPIAQQIEGKLQYEWLSSDESIATVKNGKVKGISGGTVEISCTAQTADNKEFTAKCTVHTIVPISSIKTDVKKITLMERPSGVKFDEASTTLPRYLYKPTITIQPNDASIQDLDWSTSDPYVATVSDNGAITGNGYGTATITGKAKDGSKKSVKIKVTVPMCFVSEESIVITDESGASFFYSYSSVGGISMYSTRTSGKCFEIKTSDNTDPMYKGTSYSSDVTNVHIVPTKAGKGTISFIRNGRAIAKVTVKVEKTAVRDADSYPKLNLESATKAPDKYLNKNVHVVGTVNEIIDDIAYVDVKGEEKGYIAFTIQKTLKPTVGTEYTVYGTIDEFIDYTSTTGLKYTIPKLTNTTIR